MIRGVHAVMVSSEAEQVRAFFRDVLGFSSVDSGGGWLIFALPPAELGVHPADEDPSVELSLLCADLEATVVELGARGAACSGSIADEAWGRLTYLELPGGAKLGLSEPRHRTTLDLSAESAAGWAAAGIVAVTRCACGAGGRPGAGRPQRPRGSSRGARPCWSSSSSSGLSIRAPASSGRTVRRSSRCSSMSLWPPWWRLPSRSAERDGRSGEAEEIRPRTDILT